MNVNLQYGFSRCKYSHFSFGVHSIVNPIVNKQADIIIVVVGGMCPVCIYKMLPAMYDVNASM